jgi:hypothetical protein
LHVAQITTFLKDDVTDGQTDDGMDDGPDGFQGRLHFSSRRLLLYIIILGVSLSQSYLVNLAVEFFGFFHILVRLLLMKFQTVHYNRKRFLEYSRPWFMIHVR